ncbi:hypothetical protein [Pedobacter alluvionis]|uniref:Uncharacterized protein n=1 Tax=Pedobacter alluvionis TaxID=475253 RepID=A0ABY2HQ27_9SPHI|nr:hypothetical protein [Pedobacter alluvionis]TFB30273.1 hypothetical protein E3V97_19080 [Pedobacter alluvionis]
MNIDLRVKLFVGIPTPVRYVLKRKVAKVNKGILNPSYNQNQLVHHHPVFIASGIATASSCKGDTGESPALWDAIGEMLFFVRH